MRLLVAGSRTFTDQVLVVEVLTGIYQMMSVGWQVADVEAFHLAHGAASGVDSIASLWAEHGPLHGPCLKPEEFAELTQDDIWGMHSPPVVLHRYAADWTGACDPEFCRPGHRRARHDGSTYCPAAGPRRNRLMLADFQPDRVVAFVDRPLRRSKGTFDMVSIAKAARVPVTVVRGPEAPS